ncbi:ras-related protein Rab-28-like [Bombyx mandarina]|uniref:Ras-related protein Rab-28 n=3 Tax=Bombyx TaxID=7090 RepID=A0A8R1WNX5_BOMMO|nr:ras-related protein Rab-28 isoform X1 [Bombyx mori]XP_028039442.1 ras-related protein Rab-28-like [Bombyx mandarina]
MSDSDDNEVQGQTIKITVVGEPATGKTSLCTRYLGSNASYTGGTQGAEVMAGQCLGLRPPVPLQLCDVAGNAIHTKMLANYLYASDIILFVYDLTNLQSFEKLKLWVSTIKNIIESETKKPLLALFGNKSDLEHQRAVRISCVQKFASEHLLENFKGSARTGDMVNTLFTTLVSRVMGVKVSRLPHSSVNTKSPVLKENEINCHSPLPLQAEPTHTLIMNRKALRKIQWKASSTVCSVQ